LQICEYCGKSVETHFDVCPFCGSARTQTVEVTQVLAISADCWETCEINVVKIMGKDFFKPSEFYFEATAVRPGGKYYAARSEVFYRAGWSHFNDSEYINHKDANSLREGFQFKLNDLVSVLIQDGWQPAGCGPEWYNKRFRRLMTR